MVQAVIEVTYFYFGTIVVEEDACEGDLRAGIVDLKYKDKGKKAFDIKDVVKAPPGGLILPPAPEPPSGFVGPLQGSGFSPRPVPENFVNQDGQPTGQPAALGRAGIYESLTLNFDSVFLCSCRANAKLCSAARIILDVQYDGKAHPKVTARTTKTVDCKKAAGLASEKPDKELKPKPKPAEKAYKAPTFSKDDLRKFLERLEIFKKLKQDLPADDYKKQLDKSTDIVFKNGSTANIDPNGERTVRIEFPFELPCKCPGDNKPCKLKIVCEYNYRVRFE